MIEVQEIQSPREEKHCEMLERMKEINEVQEM